MFFAYTIITPNAPQLKQSAAEVLKDNIKPIISEKLILLLMETITMVLK